MGWQRRSVARSESASHGVYHIPARPVAPGKYQVHGLWHKPLSLHFEFSIYNAGNPAWETADGTGCWLTTHTPPTSAAVVPGSRTRDGEPLVFLARSWPRVGTGCNGSTKTARKSAVSTGSAETGPAPTLAVDLGPAAVADHLCYVGSAFEGELRLTAKTQALADQPILKQKLGEEYQPHKNDSPPAPPPLDFDGGDRIYVLSGIAAHDGQIVCSMIRQNELLLVDVESGDRHSPRRPGQSARAGVRRARPALGSSGGKLVRFANLSAGPETIVTAGLEDPRQLAFDRDGNILISDRGSASR